MAPDPKRNERAPVKEEGQLPPPNVRKPIYECARAVHASFVPHAVVTVFANGAEVISKRERYFTGEADIPLTRVLAVNDWITATQEAFGFTSVQSYVPVKVDPQPAHLGKPDVGPVVYACGQVVPVSSLTPSTRVEVYSAATHPVAIDAANLVGTAENTGTWVPVVTTPLNEGWFVAARQLSCPGTNHELHSPASTSLKVSADPSPVPFPVPDTPQIAHNDVFNLTNLLVGADITVNDTTAQDDVGEGLATSDSNYVPITPDLDGTHFYVASQKLCTESDPSPPVRPTDVIPDLTLHSPICPDDTSVTISGSVVNAVVALYKSGVALPIGLGGAVNGELTLSVGPLGLPLKLGDQLYVRQYIGSSLISVPSNTVLVSDCRNVVTQHNDMRRTGAYLHETVLTPDAVAGPKFQRLYERYVNGSTFAQILYVRNVTNTKAGTKNLFFVATSTNDIYAFDADNEAADPQTPPVWHVNLWFARLLNTAEICRETIGSVGVTSTPVIDVESQIIYVVAEHWQSDVHSAVGTSYMDGKHFLHALNLRDGSAAMNAVEIGGTDPRTKCVFDPTVQRNRPGLLLLNGIIYIGFATFSCDGGDYHGWVFGYSAKDLSARGIFCSSQGGDTGAGIWQSGNGLVGSDDGFIYFETGNDKNPRGSKNATYGDSFLRLRVTDAAPFLVEAGQFQPSNFRRLQEGDYTTDRTKADGKLYRKPPVPPDSDPGTYTQIDNGDFANGTPAFDHGGDTDLGSGGPVLLPGGRLVGGGKQGRYYVIDSNSMKLTQDQASPDRLRIGEGFQAFQNTYRDLAGDKSQHYLVYAATEGFGPNIHGGPCFWPGQGLLYQMAEKDYLKAFRYDVLSLQLSQTPALTAEVRPPYGMPGGHTSISANTDKDGVIWTIFPEGDGQWVPQQGTLVAFDGLTLKELWRDPGADPGNSEWFAKFNPPTIADGKVFRPCFAQYQVPVDGKGHDTFGVPTMLKPGKVVVYGLARRIANKKIGAVRDGRAAILRVWDRHGGSGLLSAISGEVMPIADQRNGFRQDFVGHFSTVKRRASTRVEPPYVSCDQPPRTTVAVTSSLFWSQTTGAHLVTADIREEYLRTGGPAGELGYPVEDEADHFVDDCGGRISRFEYGQITWTAIDGCTVLRYRAE